MTKSDFVDALSTYAGITKKNAAESFDNVFGCLYDLLSKGEDVAIPNIGKFTFSEVAERTATNFHTGDRVVVPAHKRMSFKTSSTLKKEIKTL